MATDRLFANIGQWVCARLAGGNAVHSGDPLMKGQPRKFGIIMNNFWSDDAANTGPLDGELSRCGQHSASTFQFSQGGAFLGSQDSYTPQQMTNAVLQMKAASVTSIICLCASQQL